MTLATSSSNIGSYDITQGNLAATGSYTIGSFAKGTLKVSPAPPSATGVNFSATAGAPFNGKVASFTTSDTVDNAEAFTVTITWEDGSTSCVAPTGKNGSFTVRGSHAFAGPTARPATPSEALPEGAPPGLAGWRTIWWCLCLIRRARRISFFAETPRIFCRTTL
jgi:hypothetical protein